MVNRTARNSMAVALLLVSVAAISCRSEPSKSASTKSTVDYATHLEKLVKRSGLGAPGDVAMPEPAGTKTRDWLHGDGTAAVALVKGSKPLWEDGRSSCDEVTESLDAAGTPDELLDAALGIQDEPTREVMVNLHRFTLDLLAACSDDNKYETRVPVLAWHWAVAKQRLDHLGVKL